MLQNLIVLLSFISSMALVAGAAVLFGSIMHVWDEEDRRRESARRYLSQNHE